MLPIKSSKRAMDIVLAFLLVTHLWSCKKEEEDENAEAIKAELRNTAGAPSAKIGLQINHVDGVGVSPGANPAVGVRAIVEWTTTKPDVVTCLLVHPITANQWWVQNLPTLPDMLPDSTWSWKTTVFFGTEQHGRREQYEVLAVAEPNASVCVQAREIKVADANKLLSTYSRSQKVTVQRVRE
jgi:hypothetical protein